LLERMFFNKEVIRVSGPILLTGLGKTVGLFLWSAFFSIIIGLFFAVIIYMNNKVFNFFIILYVDFFRSIPHLVLIVVIYYALPFLGINFEPYAAGVIGLTLATSSFITEYFRAGIESVSKGQIEAAHSLGFGFFKSMRIVILPQALKVVIPPLTGQLVGLFKNTALVSVVGMQELLKRSVEVMEWKTNPTPLIVVTIMYLIILLPFAQLSIYLEKRMKKWTKRTT
ncbi:MAG: amino acid ABC transporter permease, partial [Thermotogota bacterium]|nr:amino acid ABC transporter permease [Thermotogota bacterium]